MSPAELAQRTRRHGVRIDAKLAERFLAEWLEGGVAEEVVPGRFRLSRSGEAMFGGWVGVVEFDSEADTR